MLIQLNINNLITIETLHLEFDTGTTVVTGETGTGKSILMDAIEMALGERVSEHLVRPGQEKAEISLCFDLTKLPAAQSWLKEHDLEQDAHECIIRRTINKDGRSRCYINGTPTTLQPLRALSELLIDIHGQHEHQTLLKTEKQRDMLDDFAHHASLTEQVKTLAQQWRAVNQEIMTLHKLTHERAARCEFLTFQLNELAELHLTPNEFQSLDAEHKQLAHAGTLIQQLNLAVTYLSENTLAATLQALQSVEHTDPKVAAWIETLQSATIQVNDVEAELQKHLERVEVDPERLEQIEQRISVLFNLGRKHKTSPNDLFEFQQTLSHELTQLQNSDEQLQKLTQQLQQLAQQYQDAAKELSASRKQAAKKLEQDITRMIRELALPDAEFTVHFEPDHHTEPSLHGREKIIFHIKTHAEQPPHPLAKVVSGGELSRISLAIHIATAEQHTTPTLIFDEVDVGISGGTAEIVGKLLRRLGKTHQVLCVTHLPQVAAQGHQHIRVKKTKTKQTVVSHIETLSPTEKINEIARMLGGVEITSRTLAHAQEMVEKVE